ncbi:MAG TPA: DUF1203 domain-containing protein [Lichenihabitans sp.]|jgi:hypothetical protein|nr:DUF1203 domain-containing protein [Lichenihabitans sp.]
MTFQISALSPAPFAPLFGLGDDELATHHALRRVADGPGFPCRVSLEDAEPGDTVLLVNYEHQPAPTPYRSRHAVWVREGATQAFPDPGEVPDQLRSRLLSVRAFDAAGMITAAEVVEGERLAPLAERMLDDPATAYLHLHYAKHGCYAARVDRA